jgi:hypothetical protein
MALKPWIRATLVKKGFLAVVACLAWVIDGHFEGSTVFEAFTGSPVGLRLGGRNLSSPSKGD